MLSERSPVPKVAARGRAERGRAWSFGSLAVAAAALAALIVAVAGVLYVRFVRYERIVARHVPPGTAFALRLDVQQATFYAPFRRSLLPVLGGPSLPPEEGDRRLLRIERAAGIGRADLREVLLLAGAGRGQWTVVLAGLFRHPRPEVVGHALSAEDAAWETGQDGLVRHRETGAVVAVAADGVIVIGASETAARAALPVRQADVSLAGSGGGFFMTSAWLAQDGSVGGEMQRWLGSMSRLEGRLELGERVSAALIPTPSEGKQALNLASQGLDILRGFRADDGSSTAVFVRRGAGRGSVTREAPGGPEIRLVWETEELEPAFEAAGDWIRGVVRFPPG